MCWITDAGSWLSPMFFTDGTCSSSCGHPILAHQPRCVEDGMGMMLKHRSMKLRCHSWWDFQSDACRTIVWMVVDASSDLLVLLHHDVEPNGVVILTDGWWGPVVVSSMIFRCSGSFSTRCWSIAFCAIDARRDPVVDAESIACWSRGDGCGCTNVDKMSTDHLNWCKQIPSNSCLASFEIFSRKWCQKQSMQENYVHADARRHWCLNDTDSLMSSPVMSTKKKSMGF